MNSSCNQMLTRSLHRLGFLKNDCFPAPWLSYDQVRIVDFHFSIISENSVEDVSFFQIGIFSQKKEVICVNSKQSK